VRSVGWDDVYWLIGLGRLGTWLLLRTSLAAGGAYRGGLTHSLLIKVSGLFWDDWQQ